MKKIRLDSELKKKIAEEFKTSLQTAVSYTHLDVYKRQTNIYVKYH